MNYIITIISYGFIIGGMLFILFGMFAVLRYKDLYIRLHISTKSDVVGVISIYLGLIIKNGFNIFTLKIVLIILLLIITNPIVATAIGRSNLLNKDS